MIDLNNNSQIRGAIELLYFGYRKFTAGPDRILEQHNLNRVHHRILYFVASNDALSVSALLDILCVSKQALNAPLRELVAQGLISNEPSPHDRRVKQLRLTAGGRRLERRLSATQMQQLREVFDDSGDNATNSWFEVMQRLAKK